MNKFPRELASSPDSPPPPADAGPLPGRPVRAALIPSLWRRAATLAVLMADYRTRRPAPPPGSAIGSIPLRGEIGSGPGQIPGVGVAAHGSARDVFISYSARDRDVAVSVCSALEADGVRCWIAPRDLRPGADWSESIMGAIVACPVMALILSAGSNDSVHVKREVERAVHHRKVVIPIQTEKVRPSPSLEYFISAQHWFDATPPLEPRLAALSAAVRLSLGFGASAGALPA